MNLSSLSRATPSSGGERLKPATFWLLLLAAWFARVAVGLLGDQLLHPDEIFQYLEPAHGVVFGAQIHSWEFAVGARPWIIPGFIAGVLYAFDLAGLGDPAHYIPGVKVALCTLSLILPASMYLLGRNLFGEATGRLAFVLGCFWYEFVGFAHKPLSDMVSCYFATAAMALASGRLGIAAPAYSGLMTALALGIRYLTGVLLVPFALAALAVFDLRQRLAFLATATAGLAAIALVDHLAWGGFFHSYLLNLEFNLRSDKSWDIQLPFHVYYQWPGLASAGLFWATAVWSLKDWRRYWPALALIAAFFISHQGFVHKEYRFFFPWIPLWLVVAADLLARIRRSRWLRAMRPGTSYIAMLAPFAVVSALGLANLLPQQADLYRTNLREVEPDYRFFNRDPVLQMYLALGRDSSVKGVLENSRSYAYGGGYYYLHRKIPVYNLRSLYHVLDTSKGDPKVEQFITHILALPSQTELGDSYELLEASEHHTLWRFKPELQQPVRELRNYRILLFSVKQGFPWAARYLRNERDLWPLPLE